MYLDGPVRLSEFDDPNIDKTNAIPGLLEDDSPYPEVRSAVANIDDTTIPVSTIRSWVMGALFKHSHVRETTITTHGDRNCMGHSYQRMQTFPSTIRLTLTHGGSGIEPVLLFPLPLGRNYQCEGLLTLFPSLSKVYPGIPDCSAAPRFPDWQGMGEIRPKRHDLWIGTEPRPVFYQGTCA